MLRRAMPRRFASPSASVRAGLLAAGLALAASATAPFSEASILQAPSPEAPPPQGSELVLGLRPGERARVEQGLVAPGRPACVRGRVLDGVTGRPVAGATIELWPEGWKVPHGALGGGSTLADGSFCVLHPAETWPDKVLVRARGYRSTTLSRSDCDEILLLPRTRALGLRALDLEGRPIAGAYAETRQTCAHAPPAWTGTSGADGRFDLADFPPLDDHPELVVRAPGFGAVFVDFADPLLDTGGFDVRLPRRAPVAFRVVDAEGKPMARRRISLGGEPEWVESITDDEGRARFDSPFFDRVAFLRIEDEHDERPLLGGRIPIGFEPRLVYQAEFEEPSEYFGVELVDHEGRPASDAHYVASIGERHTELESRPDRGLRSDQGPTILVAGGPFSGWNEAVVRLDQPGPARMVLEREPRLTIEQPQGTWTLHVECGRDSVTIADFDGAGGPCALGVPAGGPVLVCAVGSMETRLARLARVDADTTVDLRPETCIVARRAAPAVPAAPVKFAIDTGGVPARAVIRTGAEMLELEPAAAGLAFEFDPTSPFEGRISAEGRVPRALLPGLFTLDPARPARVELARRGSLLIRGPLRGFVAGGVEAGPTGDEGPGAGRPGWIVEDLAPGPLVADLQLTDGRVLRLWLELADGESRELTAR